MLIRHPVEGFDGHVRVGAHGLHFLAGVAQVDELPEKAEQALKADGFTVEPDPPPRRRRKK